MTNVPSSSTGVAVPLPCFNEGLSTRTVVDSCRAALAGASIDVSDHRSNDNSADGARAARSRAPATLTSALQTMVHHCAHLGLVFGVGKP